MSGECLRDVLLYGAGCLCYHAETSHTVALSYSVERLDITMVSEEFWEVQGSRIQIPFLADDI